MNHRSEHTYVQNQFDYEHNTCKHTVKQNLTLLNDKSITLL
jgi:hypothetical protein